MIMTADLLFGNKYLISRTASSLIFQVPLFWKREKRKRIVGKYHSFNKPVSGQKNCCCYRKNKEYKNFQETEDQIKRQNHSVAPLSRHFSSIPFQIIRLFLPLQRYQNGFYMPQIISFAYWSCHSPICHPSALDVLSCWSCPWTRDLWWLERG